MKKKLVLVLTTVTLSMSLLVGCSASSNDVLESTETPTATPEAHEHNYTETITTEATCDNDGVKTLTCECGDIYEEVITAVGHVFENYTSNNDATYIADGTETAKCNNCDTVDTRTAEGSMLTYTYTEMDATMYVQKSVNVRNLPCTDGEKLGGLNTNDEVKVTGQCVETSWYRIEYDGNVAYVSDSYLENDKVVMEQPKTEQGVQNTSSEFPYQLWTMYDNGSVAWFYMPGLDHGYPPEYATAYNAVSAFNHAHFTLEIIYDENGNPINGIAVGFDEACMAAGSTGDTHASKCKTEWYVNGKRVWRYFAW